MAITLDGSNGISSPDFEPSSSTIPTNGLFLPTTNTIAWATNSTERLRLDASGNLGLGVTPQTWSTGKAFSVGYSGSNVWSATESGNIFVLSNAYYNGGYKYDISGKAASYYQQNAGIHSWYTAPSGTAGAAISFTQAMTLDANGNFGVGTTSPPSGSRIAISGGALNFIDTSSRDILWGTSSYVYITGNQGTGVLAFGTGSTERARIDSSGNFLVGTTSQLIGTGATITTATKNSSVQVNIQAANGTGYDANLYFECPGIFGATLQAQRSSGLFRIWNGAGTAGVTLSGAGTSWGTFSDERLKVIVEPITDAVAKVSSLRSVIARYKEDLPDKRRSVLIAQDVQAVLPEAVYDDKSEEKYLSVAYTDTIPLLVAAIKELTQRLEKLENQNG